MMSRRTSSAKYSDEGEPRASLAHLNHQALAHKGARLHPPDFFLLHSSVTQPRMQMRLFHFMNAAFDWLGRISRHLC